MNDNDKCIAKDILLFMIDKNIGEFFCQSSPEQHKALTVDVVCKAYQDILSYVSSTND